MSFERLGSNSEFQKVYKQGRSKANRYLVMYVVKDQAGSSRYGFSVSKKVGNSVVRHRVTRLLRESVRKYDADITEGCRVVIVARPDIVRISFDEVCEAVVSMYKAHHIWKDQ